MENAHSSRFMKGLRGWSLVPVCTVGLLLSCGGGGGGSSSMSSSTLLPNTIYVGGNNGGGGYGDPGGPVNAFNPVALTVTRGTMVTWIWQGSGHSVESGAGCSADSQFNSNGLQSAGSTMTHTFNTPGTYAFFCTSHCNSSAMKGTVTVN